MWLIVNGLIFFFVVWTTTTICVQKGYSPAVGLSMGILLQPVGRVGGQVVLIGMGAELGVLPFLVALFAWPLVGGMLPVGLALLLMPTDEAARNRAVEQVATRPCDQCGRSNAVATPVCPRCGKRFKAATSAPAKT